MVQNDNRNPGRRLRDPRLRVVQMGSLTASALKCVHGTTDLNCRNLPHTGVNLLLILPSAALLVLLGVALYRASRVEQ